MNFLNIKENIAKINAEKEKEVALITAQKDKETAQINAEQAAIKAQGQADATRIKAEAEAEANRKIAESLTPELIELKKNEKWDGKLSVISGASGTIVDARNIIGNETVTE